MATRPGLHPHLRLDSYPHPVVNAVHSLANAFYVTRSFPAEDIGNSQYWAVLMRPTEEFSVYVNADRELLVVFAQYENFEIRTLEAYDEFYTQLESKRIDKSIRFLVSADIEIESKIRHYLNQYPEYPIIIPMTFRQASSPTGNAALEAIRRNYLLRDLFGYQNPLREETFFFGRQHVVNSVLDMAKSGQNSSLFGLRKSGKTSTIYAIGRKAKSFSCRTVIIDCQNPAVHARKYGELLAYIISEVRKSIGQKKGKLSSYGDSPVQISEQFVQHMKSAIGQAKGHILIIFDEIENISPGTSATPHWNCDLDALYLWQTLRSFIQAESNGKLSVCLVGTSPALLELPKLHKIANPMYLFSQKTFIPNLSFDETQEMVNRLGYFMGLEFNPELVSDLFVEYGGHPFFIRQVCSKVHQISPMGRPVKVSRTLVDRAKLDFGRQLEVYLKDIFGNLRNSYPDEFELLEAVVRGNNTEITEFGNEAPELIDHLIGYGIVEKRGDDYDIQFGAMRDTLGKILEEDTAEGRWAEISRRRNRLESDMRLMFFNWALSIAVNEWKNILEKSLTKKRFSQLTDYEPRVLFSRRGSPLYLSDLLALLKDTVVLPFLGDRRSLMLENLHVINRYRNDAHALEVNSTEMEEIRAAFEILEAEFLQP